MKAQLVLICALIGLARLPMERRPIATPEDDCKARRSKHPSLAGAGQAIDARCSMDGSALLNGWARVRQWIAQRDSMDRTARPNGWDKPCQWIDNHPSIWRGKTDRRCLPWYWSEPTPYLDRVKAMIKSSLRHTGSDLTPYLKRPYAIL